MRYSFVGKDTVVSEALKEKTIKKMSRIEKLVPENIEAVIKYTVTKFENKIEVTIPIQKRVLRAEVRSTDMYVAVDQVVDILEAQIVKYKERLKIKSRKDKSYKEEFNLLFTQEDFSENDGHIEVKKVKKFGIKPMDPEEAIMEMELLNHNFFVFNNRITDEVSVVYKRKDSTYGLLEPEF